MIDAQPTAHQIEMAKRKGRRAALVPTLYDSTGGQTRLGRERWYALRRGAELRAIRARRVSWKGEVQR
jgi:hypothetical protein